MSYPGDTRLISRVLPPDIKLHLEWSILLAGSLVISSQQIHEQSLVLQDCSDTDMSYSHQYLQGIYS
jgi:hypothetical protein